MEYLLLVAAGWGERAEALVGSVPGWQMLAAAAAVAAAALVLAIRLGR